MTDHKPTPDEVLAKLDHWLNSNGVLFDMRELADALREAIRQRDAARNALAPLDGETK